MQNSSYFHRSFTYDQNPAAAKVFFQRSSKLFEKSQENSSIEVLASNRVTSAYERTPPEIHRGDEDSDDSTDPKSINGQDHPGHENSPAHVGEPSLSPYHVSNAGDLEKLARKTKPNFRIFFLPQKHAYSRLQVTKDLYDALLKACHVFPRFNECICYLGVKFSEDEIGPPLLKYRSLENENGTFRGFECAYVLRFVEFTNRPGKEPWDLQQTVIYNRYKPPGKNACSTWILVDASKQVRAVLDRYTRQFITPALSNPFEIHLLFLDMALTNWRPYMVDLTKRITDLSNRVLVVSSEDSASETICFDDRLKLAKIEDRLIDMLLVLESSAETISILSERYQQINESLINHSTGINSRKCDTIVAVFREKAQEVSYAHKRADALLSKSRGTMKLLSTLLDYQSGNALKILGEESRSENTAMRQLAEKSTRDASAVKVLTIITLIYLPSTVVGNFYSTQFVAQSTSSEDSSPMVIYSRDAWLFFAISVPLTVITWGLWWACVNRTALAESMAEHMGVVWPHIIRKNSKSPSQESTDPEPGNEQNSSMSYELPVLEGGHGQTHQTHTGSRVLERLNLRPSSSRRPPGI